MERSREFRLMLLASPEPEPDAANPVMTIIYLFVDDPRLADESGPDSDSSWVEPDVPALAGRDRLRLLPALDDAVRPGFLAPLFFPGTPIDAAGERWLTIQAHAARDRQAGAFDLLFQALEPRLTRWAEFRVYRLRAAGPRRDGRPWLLDDLRQEGYFVLQATLESWPGHGSFLPWLLSVAPKRVYTAWQALLHERPTGESVDEADDDPELAEIESSVLIQQCLASLNRGDAQLLLAYLRSDGSLAEAGRRLGLGRGMTQYRLRRIFARLGTVLAEPAPSISEESPLPES